MNKKYEAKYKPVSEDVSWQRIEFSWVKTFNGESDSSGITDSCSGCGRPHSAHPTAKINKVKDLTLMFWSVSLPHQDFNFCQEHLEKVFTT